MTDVFTRLAARQLGTARLLTPHLPGLFEPQAASDEGGLDEVETPARPPHPVAETREDMPPAPVLARTRAPDPVSADRPPQSPAPSPPREIADAHRETRVEREVRHDHHETSHERITEIHRITQELQTHRSAQAAPAATEIAPDVPDARDDPVIDAPDLKPTTEPVSPVHETPELRERALPLPAGGDVMPPAAPPKPIPSLPPERRVDVHIAHLEIRAAPPPVRKTRVRRSADNPAPDLNTYLGGRG